MALLNDFEEFYAVADGSYKEYFRLDNELDDCENRYLPYFFIDIYGAPKEMSVEEYNKFVGGEPQVGVHIGTLLGNLILCSAMRRNGQDLFETCDNYSYMLGYCMSALTSDFIPTKEDRIRTDSIFYIDEFIFEEKYQEPEFMKKMIKKIPEIVMLITNVYPDILMFFPSPLQKEKREQVQEAEQEDNKLIQFHSEVENENKELAYPLEEKDLAVWEVYEEVGFSEVSGSRLLFTWVDKMLNRNNPKR